MNKSIFLGVIARNGVYMKKMSVNELSHIQEISSQSFARFILKISSFSVPKKLSLLELFLRDARNTIISISTTLILIMVM